ncbi:MAG TPA: phosphoribosylanthranilate isomerase, partial [Candidatus Limnocylindrales bacterium]|nr:phosphoribosylanthranilate isomerase [Candidatus Limnocylindrales bacterium]
MFRIKICGITSAEDAAMAASLGADAIGINFYKGSRRYVPASEAAPIIAALRGKAVPVGVFVNELPEVIEEVCRRVRIEVVQLSGNEP